VTAGPGASTDRAQRWARDNQRHVVLAAAAAAARLDARPADADQPAAAADALAADVLAGTGSPVALDRLALLFRLTRFERDLLLATAAPELTLPAATGPVTYARALAALPEPHWSALLPDAPLRAWSLLDVPTTLPPAEFGGLSQLPLAVDERVLHALLGAATVDPRLAGRARIAEPVCRLAAAQRATSVALAALIDPAVAQPGGVAALVGEDRLTRRQAVLDAAAALGRSVVVTDAADVPDEAPQADVLARLLAREAALGDRVVLVEATQPALDRAARVLTAVAGLGVPTVLSIDEAPADADVAVLRLPAASRAEREQLFADALRAAGLPGDAAALAEARPLTPAAVALGVERAARLAAVPGASPDVAAACAAAGHRPLRGLATVRRATGRLADLVLAESAERALRALLAHVRQRVRVHAQWGYAERGRGLAVTALLTGPSGTGKTTAAEAVAAELGLDLVTADLSQVVSKYVGETEKNLAELFAVGESGAVLLFDEGEAVFGRRTQVKDSRDRYANLEVSYLLQRLETFGGIAIVTTNNREGIDPAFLRRMRFVVNFPFPDAEQRALLWRRAFPPDVPTDGLDPARLAQLAVSGGTIAQLALHAAFLAADAGEPVRMAHVLAAARIESDKLERPLAATEIRGWS
jgi:hypothetical protein